MDFISREDMAFLLNDWLNVPELCTRDAFAAHDQGTFDAIMDMSADMARDVFAPHYKAADANEPQLVDGTVEIIPEIGAALKTYAETGFFASAFPDAVGGMQLPFTLAAASYAHFAAANIATAAYPMLTGANARLLVEHGSEAQIDTWATPQIEGRWFGTMCLSEPQAGSSLADIRTQATPEGTDQFGDRYRLRGNKMWISGGDHQISENIVHLVLAKAPDAGGLQHPGTKGISLFVVPKFLPDGARNDVAVAGLNHKMGYRGTVNCLLNFGEGDGAIGWRVGTPGQGLSIMFHMMNEARIMVGVGAAALACRGYTQSLDYARERPQGRAGKTAKDPTAPQSAIIEHVDVRRMLLAQKAYAEGAMALVLYSARLADEARTAPGAAARDAANRLLGLLTPITKSWPSEFGLVANDHAIQIHGGYGYTREYDVEQVYRDNRLNPIHEGTFGIQSLDFLGRKVLSDGGAALDQLAGKIRETATRAGHNAELSSMAAALLVHLDNGLASIDALKDKADADILDNANHALSGFGHLVVAWLWLDQALEASGLEPGKDRLRAAKQATCRYFFDCELPKVTYHFHLLGSMNRAVASVPAELF